MTRVVVKTNLDIREHPLSGIGPRCVCTDVPGLKTLKDRNSSYSLGEKL